jgi:hypothetical protein
MQLRRLILPVLALPLAQAASAQEPVEAFAIRVDEEGEGGVLRLQWDRTEAYAPFRVGGGR